MPTRTDFEMAAELFMTAAGLISELAISATTADAAQILRGGSLGRQVPERIAAAADTASACHQQVIQAAELCVERAAMIAEYEWRVEMYEFAYRHFMDASRDYGLRHTAWFLDTTGTVAHPGLPPTPPTKPTRPPSWAQVRQP